MQYSINNSYIQILIVTCCLLIALFSSNVNAQNIQTNSNITIVDNNSSVISSDGDFCGSCCPCGTRACSCSTKCTSDSKAIDGNASLSESFVDGQIVDLNGTKCVVDVYSGVCIQQ